LGRGGVEAVVFGVDWGRLASEGAASAGYLGRDGVEAVVFGVEWGAASESAASAVEDQGWARNSSMFGLRSDVMLPRSVGGLTPVWKHPKTRVPANGGWLLLAM